MCSAAISVLVSTDIMQTVYWHKIRAGNLKTGSRSFAVICYASVRSNPK